MARMDDFRKTMRRRVSAKWRLQDPSEDWCLGVSSMKAWYDAPLDRCVAAAREALKRHDLIITGGDLRAYEARIDARSDSDLAELVRMTIISAEKGGSWVSFSAGREWTQDGTQVIESLREAFECCLKARGGNPP